MMTERVRVAMETLVAMKNFKVEDIKNIGHICESTFWKYRKEFNIKAISEDVYDEMSNEEVLEILQAAGAGEDFYGYCEEFALKDGKFYKVHTFLHFEVE